MITAKLITDAWAHLRKTENSIPDEVLDFMKDVSLKALKSKNTKGAKEKDQLPPDANKQREHLQKLAEKYTFQILGYKKQKYPSDEWDWIEQAFIDGYKEGKK